MTFITQCLTLNLLTTTIVAPPSNASKWQMGFNSAFRGLNAYNVVDVLSGMLSDQEEDGFTMFG